MLHQDKMFTMDEIRNLHLKAAVYIRMSTELQTESPENQEREIKVYADNYNIKIVKKYIDLGVSGITAEGREQFMALIDDVEQGRSDFNIVLYLDESRWGRFANSREADFYRMRLERKNVTCHACDQPFTLNSTVVDRILTLLKDASASDYNHQLSHKVWIGQCHLVEKGYRQGGVAGFGLRRMLLDEFGSHKQELAMGQRKSLQTERVILVPGPGEEQEIIFWIYDQFIAGKRESEIAKQLNEKGVNNHFGRLWSRGTVREVLTNEKYIGNNLFNRTSGKLKSKAKLNPESEWIRKEDAFYPVVDAGRFYKVQGIYQERNKKITNEELLQGLHDLYSREGRLSALIIDEAKSLPPSSLFRARFGGLVAAYKLIGFTPERDYQYIAVNQYLRALHSTTVEDVINSIENLAGRRIYVDPETHLLELNHNLFISIVICRCFTTPAGTRRWKIRLDSGLHPDITIAVRMDSCNKEIQDYYILPALEFPDMQMKIAECNTGFLDSFRTDSLDYLFNLSINIPIDKAVRHATDHFTCSC